MAKTSRKPVQKKQIKNISLTDARLQECFEALKSQVKPNEKVMLAVSGGSDSILAACLVYNFFVKNKYSLQNLYFIHCNHGTRTGNAKDEQFVRVFFEGTQLIVVKRTGKKKNTEADLRERRYGEFRKQAKKYDIKTIIF